MNKVSLEAKKEQMIQDIEKLFNKIYENRHNVIVSLVEDDLRDLHFEIQRTTSRIGL